MFHENAVLKICYCCGNNAFFLNLCQVGALDQEPLSKISHRNERPDTVVFEVEATLVEYPLKIFTTIPANFNTVFTHSELVEGTTSLYGLMVPSKSWVWLLPFLHSEERNIYSSRAVITHIYLSSE